MKQLAKRTVGIFERRPGSWEVMCALNGSQTFLGTYHSKEEAAKRYDDYLDKYDPKGTRRRNFVEIPEAPPGAIYVPLSQGKFALVDASDYEYVSKYRWTAVDHKHTWYASRYAGSTGSSRGLRIYMHVELTGFGLTDHRDGDGLNNRRDNLRAATHSANTMNKVKTSNACSSQYKGVSKQKRQPDKWNASIRLKDDRKVYLGRFVCEQQAALAYNEAAKYYFGEFARLNETTESITQATLDKIKDKIK